MTLVERMEKLLTKLPALPEPFYLRNLVAAALENNLFRQVVFTSPKVQFTLMSVPPGGEVGSETHQHVTQTFFIVSGKGRATLNGSMQRALTKGDVLVVPPRTPHNLETVGMEPLKLYSSYSPPNHLPNRIHPTKADADADAADETFGQSVT